VRQLTRRRILARSSKYALMWQWSGGGGVTNGHGDFDQIDVARLK
jgi:hypothetical protein